MPSKQVHDAISSTASVAAFSIGQWVVGLDPALSVTMMFGVWCGIPLTPDLDVAENRKKRTVWNIFWYPYAKFMPHRHPLSHWPVLSTLLRLLYIVLLPALVLLAFDQWYNVTTLLYGYRDFVIAWFFGLVISDTLHWFADIITTYWKRHT